MSSKSLYICFLFIVSAGFRPGFQQEASEYDLKAAFVYNFTKFIDWNSYLKEEEFFIGIVGNSKITSSLNAIAQSNKVGEKKIRLRQFSKIEDIDFCHILFISNDTSISLQAILEKAAVKGTLIISEKEGYAKKGTCLNFIILNNKLKFEANMKAINAADLKAGAQLLKLAIVID
jgi:hypothetical protein